MKQYKIYYEIKANRTEETWCMEVTAESLKDAKAKVKDAVKVTGHHAFHVRSEAQQIKALEELAKWKAELGIE